MSERIVVIYERGILRPVKPLRLPEQTWLEIQLMPPTQPMNPTTIRQMLRETGVIGERPALMPEDMISEEQLSTAARKAAIDGPLSELILSQRDE